MVLGKSGAKRKGPNPRGVRVANSPNLPAMHRQLSHGATCRRFAEHGQLGFGALPRSDRNTTPGRSSNEKWAGPKALLPLLYSW